MGAGKMSCVAKLVVIAGDGSCEGCAPDPDSSHTRQVNEIFIESFRMPISSQCSCYVTFSHALLPTASRLCAFAPLR